MLLALGLTPVQRVEAEYPGTSPPEAEYEALKRSAAAGRPRSPVRHRRLITCVKKSLALLATLPRTELRSEVPGKEYFAFNSPPSSSSRSSRGINYGPLQHRRGGSRHYSDAGRPRGYPRTRVS